METNCLAAKPARSVSPLYRGLELLCWGLGLALLAYALLAKIHEAEASEAGLRAFALAAAGDIPAASTAPAPTSEPAISNNLLDEGQLQTVDKSLWSKKRIAQFEDIHKSNSETPLAVLRIDDLKILVPIYIGTSEFNLNRGAGWVEETAPVDGRGNIVLAAHRDSFFRALKDAKKGQKMTLQTLETTRHFTLDNIQIIGQSETSVLEPSNSSKLTLVTCYPFYHVGSAPQRYIVTATEDISAPKPKE